MCRLGSWVTCNPPKIQMRRERFSSVTILGSDLVINEQFVISAAKLTERFSRSSGPGGQGVNTTDSRVELSFRLVDAPSVPEDLRVQLLTRLASRLTDGVLTLAASEHRTQLANREAARLRLIALLREASTPPSPPRRPTKPSRGSKERR